MSAIVKSFSVEDSNGEQGDMFYIQHQSSNFSIIDCCLNDYTKERIVREIIAMRKGKAITRVISTHPDEDHISGIEYLDQEIGILNFYCVNNKAIKDVESESFKHYCKLRDDDQKHYYVYKGCKRKWMNDNDETDGHNYGSSGINFLWPIITNEEFKNALSKASKGVAFNNISPVFTYSLQDGVTILWMGDMEHDFLEKVKDNIDWPEVDILFAPHHGRESGKVSADVLKKINPSIIIVGEAPSVYLDYYNGYNTITQNSAQDIVFLCEEGKVHIYVSADNYSVSFLKQETVPKRDNEHYIGTLYTHK